jgi:hypothetical protein
MGTRIHEPVTVGVVFEQGAVRPAWFSWRGRRYAITDVTLRWHTKEGSAALLHLGVSDGATLFELAFNQQTLTWMLEEVATDG